MNALRSIHAALVPGGLVVDTQPVSARPPIQTETGAALGTLDMREWGALVGEVDAHIAEAIAAGLFTVEQESGFCVTDRYDDGAEFVTAASAWMGTRIPRTVQRRVAAERGPVLLHQDVRMRVLRAGPARRCRRRG